MKLRLWPRRSHPEPPPDEAAVETAPEPEPQSPEPEPTPATRDEEVLPAMVSLTLGEAKDAIRTAKGDVMQVGFLAGVYRRQRAEDPRSGETVAARAQLCEVIAKRLRDRKLLAPDGVFELRDEAAE